MIYISNAGSIAFLLPAGTVFNLSYLLENLFIFSFIMLQWDATTFFYLGNYTRN